MNRSEQIVEWRETLIEQNAIAAPAKGILDAAAIVCSAIPGLGLPGAVIDNLSKRIGPEPLKVITELAALVGHLASDLDAIEGDSARIEATLKIIEENQTLQSRLVTAIETLEAGGKATISSSDSARQTFKNVVFRKLKLEVESKTGATNHLSGVRQVGPGAAFIADGGSNNFVERSEFTGERSTVLINSAALRGVELNTNQAAVVVAPSSGRSVGIQIGGADDGSAAMYIPHPGEHRIPNYLSIPMSNRKNPGG